MPILRALLGLAFFCGVAWLLSTDKKRINVRVVAGGILLQFGLALIILKTDWGAWVLNKLSTLATTILGFGEEGARMVFGPLLTGWNVVPVGPDANQPISFFTAEPAQIPEGLAAYAAPVSFAFGALTTIIYFSALMAILYHLGIVQFLVKILASTMRWTLKVSGAESLAMA
ncbi:MAG: CNT family concentrative nucleoside transporter, partial [Planctomycetota bacterium]